MSEKKFDFLDLNDKRELILTYVHEMQHLITYNWENNIYSSFVEKLDSYLDNKYSDEVVIESLARWFECYYDKYVLKNENHHIDEMHFTRDVITYPYDGAWYIEHSNYWNENPIDKFNKLFHCLYSDKNIEYTKNGAIFYLLMGTEKLKSIL